MIQIKYGNLLQAEETIIAHQVNCFGVAGGLAYHIFNKWPAAKSDYQQLVNRISQIGGNISLLGMAMLTGQQKDGKIVANLFGQYFPGRDFRPLMIERSMSRLAIQARSLGASIALPYGISCGICGGDWDVVLPIIERTLDGLDVTIYKLE